MQENIISDKLKNEIDNILGEFKKEIKDEINQTLEKNNKNLIQLIKNIILEKKES